MCVCVFGGKGRICNAGISRCKGGELKLVAGCEERGDMFAAFQWAHLTSGKAQPLPPRTTLLCSLSSGWWHCVLGGIGSHSSLPAVKHSH